MPKVLLTAEQRRDSQKAKVNNQIIDALMATRGRLNMPKQTFAQHIGVCYSTLNRIIRSESLDKSDFGTVMGALMACGYTLRVEEWNGRN